MKIVTLIQDGRGHLHLLASSAPDLVRREISAEKGCAELVWCGLGPRGIGARKLVAQLQQRFGLDSQGRLQADKQAVVEALIRATVTRPRRRERLLRLKQLWRRMLKFVIAAPRYARA